MSASEAKNVPSGASDMAHIVLTFDNNRLASALYGQFDENLARLEQKLGVDISSRGNQLTIKGDPDSAEQARRSIDHLYGILQKGGDIAQSDVDGAVRMAMAADDIEALIVAAIPDARVEIRDLAGDGDHYAARVVSASFAGMSRVRQHQAVYAALGGRMGGELHALQLETAVPSGDHV